MSTFTFYNPCITKAQRSLQIMVLKREIRHKSFYIKASFNKLHAMQQIYESINNENSNTSEITDSDETDLELLQSKLEQEMVLTQTLELSNKDMKKQLKQTKSEIKSQMHEVVRLKNKINRKNARKYSKNYSKLYEEMVHMAGSRSSKDIRTLSSYDKRLQFRLKKYKQSSKNC